MRLPALTLFLPHPALTKWRWAVAGTARGAAATAVRPNYLLAWCLLPLFALTPGVHGRRGSPLPAVLRGVFVFAAVAIWQWRVSAVDRLFQ
jgi:hypothetical protein